jgi:hypothetical protein
MKALGWRILSFLFAPFRGVFGGHGAQGDDDR